MPSAPLVLCPRQESNLNIELRKLESDGRQNEDVLASSTSIPEGSSHATLSLNGRSRRCPYSV